KSSHQRVSFVHRNEKLRQLRDLPGKRLLRNSVRRVVLLQRQLLQFCDSIDGRHLTSRFHCCSSLSTGVDCFRVMEDS
ncbi:hypothetical protein PFISCL1PPCAC_1092, partial [Pristionchus fissidentatus]